MLYLQKVGAFGIFSQEGEVEVSDNKITNFKEGITLVIADFELESNTIDFTETAITANNSEGRISNNIVTNNTETINSYKSEINLLSNVFNDFEKGVYSYNSTILIDNNIFSEGDFCLDLIDSDYNLQNNEFNCRETDYLVRYNLRIKVADEQGTGFREHGFNIENSFGTELVDAQTDEQGFSDYYMIDIISKAADENAINYNPIKIIYYNNEIMVEISTNLSYNHTLLALLDTTSPESEIIPGFGLIN